MTADQNEQAQLLIDTFEILGNWEERYRFLIDLGRDMPPLSSDDKIDLNKVEGCLSSVWVVAQSRVNGEQLVIDFTADSDSAIVRGLISMLRKIYSGKTPHSIVHFDIDAFFASLDLAQHLSMGRRNGLGEMVRRIKSLAASLSVS